MKKCISLLLAVTLVITLFAGCSAKENTNESTSKIKVVTTIYPMYDWIMNIAGDDKHTDITVLLNNGVDIHNYQPTADDIIKISTCDLFIYVGGESDKWVDDTLNSAQNKNMRVINLMDVLGESAKEEKIIEGMQAEAEHDHEGEEEKTEYDEHVWLSLKNASKFVDEITKVLCELDSKDTELYTNNASAYKEKLSALDKEYQQTVASSKNKTLLFGDRFPFRYMVDDYGLNYYAAYVGCAAESEESFETLSFLANKVNELSLGYVMTIDGSDQKIAKTIIANTKTKNQKVLTLDSMQSITQEKIDSGENYLSIMKSNLAVLQEALS